MPSGKIIAIGDIHGHYKDLVALLARLKNETDFESDTFIFLGDYVDGGPDTAKVIELLRSLQKKYPHWVFLKGNHEDMLLEAVRGRSITYGGDGGFDQWWNQGGKATATSYKHAMFPDRTAYETSIMQVSEVIPASDLDWMEGLPLYHETDNHIFVHAGLVPDVALKDQNELDLLWVRSLFYNSDYDWGKRVIFGHSWAIPPVVHKNKIGIDTLSRFEKRDVGHLSAVILKDDRQNWHEFFTNDPETTLAWNKIKVKE